MAQPPPNKNLGQHYLKDKSVIDKITSWNQFGNAPLPEAILEIGPGPGALTHKLASFDCPLHLIEKDERFISELEKITTHINLTDALHFDLAEYIQKEIASDNVWLVSNLPYNIAGPLFIKFCYVSSIKYMTLMFQKEMGDKTYLRQDKNLMNSLLAMSLSQFDSKLLCKVPKGAFNPPPRVMSNVVSYQRKEAALPPHELKGYEKFCRHLFSFKRKQLLPSLGKEKWTECFESLGLKLTLRAEELSLSEVKSLYYFQQQLDKR